MIEDTTTPTNSEPVVAPVDRQLGWCKTHPKGQAMTAEQKARNMLTRLGVEEAQSFSAGDLVELANLIADHDHAKKQIKAASRLLERAIDSIPDFIDGRNDRLVRSIEKWIDGQKA